MAEQFAHLSPKGGQAAPRKLGPPAPAIKILLRDKNLKHRPVVSPSFQYHFHFFIISRAAIPTRWPALFCHESRGARAVRRLFREPRTPVAFHAQTHTPQGSC